ncbi:putative RNA-directed DNA polymerase from transposon X-element [Trichonephila clavipes]|nr:putative RNA-directed DNA polymerase from transposon X-element [Trichonephila clavipes]
MTFFSQVFGAAWPNLALAPLKLIIINWALFTQLAVISDAMVKTESVDTAVQDVTNVLIDAADLSIPKSSSHSFRRYKPWWNADCQTAYKNQRKLWGTFRRYPTTENLIAFKRAKALARRLRRQCRRESWIKYVSSITSSTTSQHLWRKVKAANGLYRYFFIPILETSTAIYSSPVDVVNVIGQTFASVSSSDSYSPAFQATKNRLERTPINFRCRQPLPYNCDFDMSELKRALSSAHNTSPGPDGISYVLLRHLSEDSLASQYVDDLQISCEGSDMRMIERQLQTAVNNIVQWCDTNGPLRGLTFFRVSAADKGCRAYPLDPRPDAVALYSGCTLGKRRAWFLPDDRHTASLVGLRGGWRHARMKFLRVFMDPLLLCPGGVISEPDLLTTSESEILEGFFRSECDSSQKNYNKKTNTTVSPTKHLILTFNSLNLPISIKAGYLNCKIRPYIPNPLRCFAPEVRHSQTSCRGQLTCSRCASVGHASTDCSLEPKCINCSQPHTADSKLCPKWKTEKQIQK